jgi:hypothetical protein
LKNNATPLLLKNIMIVNAPFHGKFNPLSLPHALGVPTARYLNFIIAPVLLLKTSREHNGEASAAHGV